jgi:perosamine synthetase
MLVTTGGGGALLTSDEALAARARHLTTTAKNDRVEFSHDAVGYNYRLTNVAAALGVAQLEQLDAHVLHKRATARAYGDALKEADLQLHPEPARCTSIFWMYTVLCRAPARPSIDRLIARGIQARPLWIPLHRLPAFDSRAHVVGADVANRLYAHALSLPCSVGISDEEIERVSAALLEILATAAQPAAR